MEAATAIGAAAEASGAAASGLEVARAVLKHAQELDAAALQKKHEEAVAALARERDT